MFYVFQLGTNMLLFTCLYIVEIIVLVTGISIGLSIEEVENVFLFSFPCLLTFGFCFLITSKKNPNETVPKKPVFHPTSTFRKRLANKIIFAAGPHIIITVSPCFFDENPRTICTLVGINLIDLG